MRALGAHYHFVLMGRAERKALLQQIENLRGSRVVAYITGDRAPAQAQIGDDAVRPLYDHLRSIGHVPKLDFLIYSRGGANGTRRALGTQGSPREPEWVPAGDEVVFLGRESSVSAVDVGLFATRGDGSLFRTLWLATDLVSLATRRY